MNPEVEIEAKNLLDHIYGWQTPGNWEACKSNWMKPEHLHWLRQTVNKEKNKLKMKKLFPIASMVALLCGCSSNPPLTHALFRAAVTSGEQIALETHPEATPYIRAAVPIVCSVANSTNANAAAVVDALMATGIGTNRTAILIINGSINLLNVAEAALGGTNQSEIKVYVQDLCVAMGNGLPPANAALAKHAKLRTPHLK